MNSPNYEIIKNALIKRQQVFAIYKGHKREMWPYVIGKKNEKEQALFYQFGGTSSRGIIVPGSKDNWCCMHIDELSEITVRDGEWFTHNSYNKEDKSCVDDIDEQV